MGSDGDSEADGASTDAALAAHRGQSYDVYAPAEDSAILAGEAADDLAGEPPAIVLDVGTGSGYVGERVATATGARVIGIDVNPVACRQARERGIETVRGDLVAPFADGTFDAVTFNPPYLPAVEGADWDDWFETAITGGEMGRELVDRFLDDVGRVLAPDGVVYLLVSTHTGVEAVVERAAEQGFGAAALADVPFPGETLTVLKLVR